MHPAAPVEAADRIGRRPPLHRVGPLLGEVVLRQPLQRADQLAIDDAGRQPIQLARHGRTTGGVEQGQPLLDVPVEDPKPCIGDPADGACSGIA